MTDAYLFSEIEAACLARVQTNFLSLPVIGENDGGEGLSLSSGFVMVAMSNIESQAISVNVPILMHCYGAAIIDVNVPVNTGTALSRQYCDAIAFLFRDVKVWLANGHLRFTEKTSVDTGGQVRHDKEGLFYRSMVTCPFYYQIFKAS